MIEFALEFTFIISHEKLFTHLLLFLLLNNLSELCTQCKKRKRDGNRNQNPDKDN